MVIITQLFIQHVDFPYNCQTKDTNHTIREFKKSDVVELFIVWFVKTGTIVVTFCANTRPNKTRNKIILAL